MLQCSEKHRDRRTAVAGLREESQRPEWIPSEDTQDLSGEKGGTRGGSSRKQGSGLSCVWLREPAQQVRLEAHDVCQSLEQQKMLRVRTEVSGKAQQLTGHKFTRGSVCRGTGTGCWSKGTEGPVSEPGPALGPQWRLPGSPAQLRFLRVTHGPGAARGEQVPPSLPSLPKTEPSCFQKRLEPGSFQICFTAKPPERSGGDAPIPSSFLLLVPGLGTSACLFCSSNSQLLAHGQGQCRAADASWGTEQ